MQTGQTPRRRRFTVFGAILFGMAVVLLVGQVLGAVTKTSGLISQLASGFGHVDAFSFARNYINELNVAATNTHSPMNAASFLAVIPAAIGDSLQGDIWAKVAFLMALGLGVLALWNSIKQNYFWIIAVPFVGGVAAWILSHWILQFALLGLLVIAQLGALAGSVGKLPIQSLEMLHLTAEVAGETLKKVKE